LKKNRREAKNEISKIFIIFSLIIFLRLGAASKNRRKSFGPARIDIAFVKLMSGARESIRNRRRNSSVSTNGFHDHIEYQQGRMPHTLEELDEESATFAQGLKAASSINSSSNLDLLGQVNGATKRKTAPTPLVKTNSSSNFFHKNSSSSNLAADSLNNSSEGSESAQSERKSLPEKVNFGVTWVSAKLLKKHRERRLKRIEAEKSESSLSCIASLSAIDRLSEEDLVGCRLGLSEVMNNPKCLNAFREFLEKEHSGENLSFWLASEQYRQLSDRREKALEIHEKFIKVIIVLNY
jgi:hypothetical protein